MPAGGRRPSSGSRSKGARAGGGLKQSAAAMSEIPWAEIFEKHHALIDTHQQLIGTLRKLTGEGSEHGKAISAMLDRCGAMTEMTRTVARELVPPADTTEGVPIRSAAAPKLPGPAPPASPRRETRNAPLRSEAPKPQPSQSQRARREPARARGRSVGGVGSATQSNLVPLGKSRLATAQKEAADSPVPVATTAPRPSAPLVAPEVEKPPAKEGKKARKEKKQKRTLEEAAANAAEEAESTDATRADDEGEPPKKKKRESKSKATGGKDDTASTKKPKDKKPKKDKKGKQGK